MLMPKRVKRRRVHRGRMKGTETRGTVVSYGEYGLQALDPCWITSNQIEAARVAMTFWMLVVFMLSPSSEPAETRMGSGKGAPEYWVAVVRPGRVMFEIAGVPEETAREALRLAMHKLPCRCKFVKKGEDTAVGGETK